MKIDDPKSVLQRVVYNNGDSPACLKINESFFLVPGRSSFYISDLLSTDFAPIQSLGPFNVVVADPPWPNKSATRSNAYGVLDHHELYRIPFREFVAPGGVLAIWVVNRMKVIHFVKTKLFPSLGVDLVEEIAWIKVTSSGEWVFSPQSLDRKPYEFLLVGRRRIGEESSKEEPQRKAIAAIPSVHSRKPILEGILERHVEFDPADSSAPNRAIKKLELFARCLLPNWTSWGNEPLRFSSDAYLVYSKEL
ncbi:MT-A70-domain-containing protein [Cladochytrium replicatum]|nr:MT-A70-domain-containing protein [Cladochytrium replicatum]